MLIITDDIMFKLVLATKKKKKEKDKILQEAQDSGEDTCLAYGCSEFNPRHPRQFPEPH